jgi:hypothetical protein
VAVAALRVEGKAIGVAAHLRRRRAPVRRGRKGIFAHHRGLKRHRHRERRLHQALKTDYEMLTAYEYRIFED